MMDVQDFIKQQRAAFEEQVYFLTEPGVMPAQRHMRLGQFKTKGQNLIRELITYRAKISAEEDIKNIETAIKDLVTKYQKTMSDTLKTLDPNAELSSEILTDINRSMIPEAVLTGENKLASLGITSAPEKRNQAMPTSVPTAGEVFTMSQLFGLNLSMKINQIDGELITTETEFIYVINPITEDGAVVVTRFITEDKLKDFIDKSLMTTNIEPLVIYGKPVKFKRTVTLDIA